MKIFYTNAQSIFNKLNELVVYVEDNTPDLILICETWCNPTISDAALNLPNYQLEKDLRKDRIDTTNGVGGGLLVYSRIGLSILPCDKFKDTNFNQFTAFKVKTSGDPLHVILAYRPPGANQENTLQLCNMMRNLEKNSIIIGDINLPCIDWNRERASSKGRPVLEAAAEENIIQLVQFPTHCKGNTLDLVLTNCPDKVILIEDGGTLGKSDHCIINMELQIKVCKVSSNHKRPNWSKADTIGIKKFLAGIIWQQVFQEKNLEECWQSFKQIIHEAVEKYVPLSTSKPRNQPKWLSREIIRLVRRKKRAWKNWKSHGSQENMAKYKELQKKVTTGIRNAKRKMEQNLASKKNGNATDFARYIKSKTKSNTNVGPLRGENGGLITEEKEMAQLLNKYFTSVFTQEDTASIPVRGEETEAKFSSFKFTEKKIHEKIKALRQHSAPGPDGTRCVSV